MCTFSRYLSSVILAFACVNTTSQLPESLLNEEFTSRQIQYRFTDATWQGWVRMSPTATHTKILLFTSYPSNNEWNSCIATLPADLDYNLVSSTIDNQSLTRQYVTQSTTSISEPYFCE